jgi:acetyl-CoA decarbonylase/synthase complex subunit gamma
VESTVAAITEISKYGGICVLPAFDPAQMASLMTLRLNIFTDPQKPIQVEPKSTVSASPVRIHPFRNDEFLAHVFHRIGRNREQRNQRVVGGARMRGNERTDRMGGRKVLRALIAKFIKESGFEAQVKRRDIVIPVYVAQISGELEENLPAGA